MNECPRCGRCYPDSVATCATDGGVLTQALEGPCRLDGKFELQRKLGNGAMGDVYLAHRSDLHRDVAIKLLKGARHGVEFAARFRTEAAALGTLKHPHIVDVIDFGIDPRGNGIPYLVLEYLTGRTLAQELQKGPTAVADALPMLAAIASAIDFAHEHRILHRDIKPANIFLVQNGLGRPRVKVLDFGVARIDAATRLTNGVGAPIDRFAARAHFSAGGSGTKTLTLTAAGDIVGTLAYLAPEVFERASASRASDLYAFGVLAYESLVGKRPFPVESIRTGRDLLHDEPPPAHKENSVLAAELSETLAWGPESQCCAASTVGRRVCDGTASS